MDREEKIFNFVDSKNSQKNDGEKQGKNKASNQCKWPSNRAITSARWEMRCSIQVHFTLLMQSIVAYFR